jgi:hypothetical protein
MVLIRQSIRRRHSPNHLVTFAAGLITTPLRALKRAFPLTTASTAAQYASQANVIMIFPANSIQRLNIPAATLQYLH